MAVQTVTSENFAEFVTTGVIQPLEALKEAPKPEAKEEKKTETGKEEKVDNNSETNKANDSLSDADLTERAKKRIDTKHRQMREAQELADARGRELAETKAAAERLQKELDALKSGSQPKDEDKEPDPKDFDDPFKYAKALSKYESAQALKADRQTREEEQRKAEEKARIDAFTKRISEAKKALPDFEEVLTSSESILKQDGIDFIINSEYGARMAYFLALPENAEEVERLNGHSHDRRMAALGKLEARFEKPSEKQEKDPPKVSEVPQSRAPAPIATLSGQGDAVEKDPAKMTTQEYLAYREQKRREGKKH